MKTGYFQKRTFVCARLYIHKLDFIACDITYTPHLETNICEFRGAQGSNVSLEGCVGPIPVKGGAWVQCEFRGAHGSNVSLRGRMGPM